MKNHAAVVAGYIVLYVFLDWVSYLHPVLPVAITPWNPPPGLSLVFLLRFGLRYWPALFVAAFLAEVLVRGIPAPLPWLVAASLALSGCYVAIAALLAGKMRIGMRFDKLHDLTRFLMVILPGTLAAALAYVAIFTLAGLVPPADFLANVLRFWVGDAIGVMVVTPLLLVHGADAACLRHGAWRPSAETLAQAASVLLALWLIFGVEFTDEFKFFYLLFLPLIWIATRHGIQGATLAILGIQLGLIATLQWSGHRATAVLDRPTRAARSISSRCTIPRAGGGWSGCGTSCCSRGTSTCGWSRARRSPSTALFRSTPRGG